MSNNRLIFDGLEELKAELLALPAELARDGDAIVESNANSAADDVVLSYPERTGDLRDHVSVQVEAVGQFGASVLVVNTSRLAWIFENGSQARHTELGANRGSMPAGHVFIPRMITWRRRMYGQLAQLVESHGLTVTGAP